MKLTGQSLPKRNALMRPLGVRGTPASITETPLEVVGGSHWRFIEAAPQS